MSQTTGIDLSRENPYLTIWVRPRATIRGIVNKDPSFRVLPIAAAGGILQALQLAVLFLAGDQLSVSMILFLCVLIGPPLGLVLLYLGAWIVELSCRMLGGQADSREVRAAMAWSSVPFLATAPLWIIRIALVGKELFNFKPGLVSSAALAYLVAATTVPEVVLSIWWLVATLKALAEVQRFSSWRAAGSMLLLLAPFVVLIVIVAIVAYFLVKNLLP
jgi:Yip1 domain